MRWSEEELAYLKQWYGIKTAEEIGLVLGFSSRKIIGKAYNLGLKSKLTKQPKNTIMNLEKRDVKLIGKILGSRIKTDFLCPYCNTIFQTEPTKVASGHTKSCGCASIGKRRGTTNISLTYFNAIKNGAKSRNIDFNISIEYIDELLIKQNFKCALSGVALIAGYVNCRKGEQTASLDRINSYLGYVVDNVQWVHRDINLAKQSFSQEYFIELCKRVYKWTCQ